MTKLSPKVLQGIVIKTLTENHVVFHTAPSRPMTKAEADAAAQVLTDALRLYGMVRKTQDD